MRELAFAKGHGARNDFVLFADPTGELDLTDRQVAGICDRRAGIGADGVLRAVRDPEGLWFMDYRNADGSVAEMCGNGLRVFLRFLATERLADGDTVTVATRAGRRTGRFLADGRIAVTMGRVGVAEDRPQVRVGDRAWQGVPADVGNPHVVSIVSDAGELDGLDLSRAPEVPAGRFPQGVNAEFALVEAPGRVRMRVHERGSGETCACGTGVVAVAVVAGGAVPGGPAVVVSTPGGDLEVSLDEAGEAILTGPAVLVARGSLDLEVIGS